MNKAVDIFLRDFKPDIERLAKEVGIVHTVRKEVKEKLQELLRKELPPEKCPFCGNEEPELLVYDYCLLVQCRECGGSGALTSDSDPVVYSDFCQFAYMIDERFMEGGEWGPDKSEFPDETVALLRTSLMFVAAWWAIGKWNRRA